MKGSVGAGRGVAEVRLAVRLAHPPADVPPDRPAEGRPPANVPNSTDIEHVIGTQRARKRAMAYENPPFTALRQAYPRLPSDASRLPSLLAAADRPLHPLLKV